MPQRRFARENTNLLSCEEPEDKDDEDASNFGGDDAASLGKRKKLNTGKKSHGGRVPKGEDWWSQVNKWFQQKRQEWGDLLSSSQWKLYGSPLNTCSSN